VAEILGCSSPKALQRTVFFYSGKNFILRGGEEQRRVKPPQLICKKNPDPCVYVETGSKNRSGGLNVGNKVVPIYASAAAGERCLVYLLDLYLSKQPSIAFEKDVMYWKPKTDIPKNPSEPWYVCQPVGKHKLNGMVAQTCEEAHLHERKMSISPLSGTTSLYKGGVPERKSSRELVTVP